MMTVDAPARDGIRMASDISVAVIGLVGGVLGTAASFGAFLIKQRADERAARQERQDVEDGRKALLAESARVSARIIHADTRVLKTRLTAARTSGRFWSEPFSLPLQTWQSHREALAKHLNLDAWTAVSQLMRTAEGLESYARAARQRHPMELRPQLGPESRKAIELALKRVGPALAALAGFTKDPIDPVPEEAEDDEA